jgi:hypothetical protein
VIRHVVVLTWTDHATAADVAAVHAALGALPAQVPEIRAFAFGPDLGIAEGNAQFAIVADFDDTDAWRRYQDHPAHRAVLTDRIRPITAARAAVQFELAP